MVLTRYEIVNWLNGLLDRWIVYGCNMFIDKNTTEDILYVSAMTIICTRWDLLPYDKLLCQSILVFWRSRNPTFYGTCSIRTCAYPSAIAAISACPEISAMVKKLNGGSKLKSLKLIVDAVTEPGQAVEKVLVLFVDVRVTSHRMILQGSCGQCRWRV